MGERCAVLSRTFGEQPYGTASRARRWLLVEHPGAWGADVLEDGTVSETLASHLRHLAAHLPARVLLLRRAGERSNGPGRTVLIGVTDQDGGWLEEFVLDRPEDLLDLDLTPLADSASVGGRLLSRPRYLVCTNGRHDVCCAEYGRPLAQALHPVLGGRLWECSHIGGDRFAGNLACLPSGQFYGQLDPDGALGVVAAHEAGEVALAYWRGRSDLPFVAQAAEAFVRRELQLSALGDLRFLGMARSGDHRGTVRFRLRDGSEVVVVIRVSHDPSARPLTCSDPPAHAPVYELLDMSKVGSG